MFNNTSTKWIRMWYVAVILCLVPMLQRAVRAEINVGDVPPMHPEVSPLFEKAWQAYQDKNLFAIMPLLNAALAKSREVGDKVGETLSLFAFSEIYKKLGAADKATEYEKQAQAVMEAGGDKASTARIVTAIGTAYVAIAQERRALEYFQQALKLRRELADKSGEAGVLILLGNIQQDYFAQPATALALYQQALALSREAKDQGREAEALYYVASLDEQPKEAIEHYQQALSFWRKAGDEANQARALYRIGEKIRGDQPQKGMEMFQEALRLQRGVTVREINRETKADGTRALGKTYLSRRQEALLLMSIGGLHMGQGQLKEALESFEQALQVSTEISYKTGRAAILNQIGAVYEKMGQPQKGLEFVQQSLQLYRESGSKPITAFMLLWEASLEEPQGRLADAEAHRSEGLMLLEELRESIGGQAAAKMGYLEGHLPHYYAHINLLLRVGKTAEAFAWAEKTKARALLDLMYDGKVDISKEISAAEQQQERTLRQRVETLNQQLIADAAGGLKSSDAIKPQIAQAEAELQSFTGVLDAQHPGLAQKRAARTVTLDDVAQFLPEDTALLNYVALDKLTGQKDSNKDNIVLFAVTNEGGKGSIQSYRVQIPRDELIELLDDFRDACADPQKSYKSKARELYTLLLSPAATQLARKKRVVICPDGPLWGTPFQALMTGDQFLQEQYEVTYAYSGTAAQAALASTANTSRAKPSKTLMALANPHFGGAQRFSAKIPAVPEKPQQKNPPADAEQPSEEGTRLIDIGDKSPLRGLLDIGDKSPLRAMLSRDGAIAPLPGTQREADALKADFPDALIETGVNAQEAVVKKESGQFRYLHFATHGLFNDAAPMLSSVVLAEPPKGSPDDGFLTAREIFDLNWNADLVVLSACDTGRGTRRSGEGIIGLTWAVFVAGVPTQVVSQWAVNDASTAELMKQFYAQIKDGKAKGAALREANLKLMKDGQHSHPFYWAPFILLGDWRH